MMFPEKPGEKLDLAQRKAAAAGLIQGGLIVDQAPNSSLMSVFHSTVRIRDGRRTIANAVAQGFTEANLERRYGTSEYARKFLEEKLAELKVKLEESEKALVAYEDKEQIITSKGKDQQPLADSDLLSLNAALQQVRTERIRAQELWEQASKNKGTGLAADSERQINCSSEREARHSRFRLSGKACDVQTRLS